VGLECVMQKTKREILELRMDESETENCSDSTHRYDSLLDELFTKENIKKFTLGVFDKMFRYSQFHYVVTEFEDFGCLYTTNCISYCGLFHGKSIYACVRYMKNSYTSIEWDGDDVRDYENKVNSIPDSILQNHPSFNISDYVCVVENIPHNEHAYQTFINYDNIKTFMLFVFEGNMLKLSKCKLLFKTFMLLVAHLWGFADNEFYRSHDVENFNKSLDILPSIYHQMMKYMKTYKYAKFMLKHKQFNNGLQKLIACNNNVHRLWHNGLLQYKPYVFHIKTIPFLLICYEGVVAGNEQYDCGTMVIGNDYLLRQICKFL
jgi:hypothetical protein